MAAEDARRITAVGDDQDSGPLYLNKPDIRENDLSTSREAF